MAATTLLVYDLLSFNGTIGGTGRPAIDMGLPRAQSITVTGNVMQWVYSGLGIVGLINNLFVVLVIFKTESMRKEPRNWLIFHHSLADIICSIFVIAAIAKKANMNLKV